jgi:hypothetical protein
MKLTLLSTLAATMVTLTTALPTTTTTPTPNTVAAADLAPRDNWLQYIQDYPEGGLQRWRYDYRGYSADNWGQDFLAAIRRHGGTANNWQAYDIGKIISPRELIRLAGRSLMLIDL